MGDEAAPRARVVRNPAALWRHTLDGVVVLGPDDEDPQVLEPPGDAIWVALADPADVGELAATMVNRYAAAPDVVQADVERFVARLLDRGLVVEVLEPPTER